MKLEPHPPKSWLTRAWPMVDLPVYPRDRRSISFHEAGHIVVNLVHGGENHGAVLHADGGAAIHRFGPSADFKPDIFLQETPPLSEEQLRNARRQIVAILHAQMLRPRGIDRALGIDAAVVQPFNAEDMQDAVLALVSSNVAGLMCEILLHGHDVRGWYNRPHDSDFDSAREYLLLGFGHDLGLYYCMRRARSILSENWSWVERIAGELEDIGVIDEKRIEQLREVGNET